MAENPNYNAEEQIEKFVKDREKFSACLDKNRDVISWLLTVGTLCWVVYIIS